MVYFDFHRAPGIRLLRWAKGGGRWSGLAYGPCGWQSLMPRLSMWLGEVKRDLETPDLWAELQREAKLLGVGSSELIENTPFTPDEQKEIAKRLNELAKYLKLTYSLSQAQMKALDEKVDYFIEASNRVGRKDWLNIFIGGIFGYILSAAVPTESARNIFLSSLRAIGLLYPELLIE